MPTFAASLPAPAIVAAVLILSLVLPVGIFFGQSTVGERRLAIIRYLRACADDIDPDLRAFMIRSLDFTAVRYAPPTHRGFRFLAYLLPTALFVVLSAFGFLALFAVLSMEPFQTRNLVLFGLQSFDATDFAGYQAGTALIVAAAFLGAYIWSVNYLLLRVSNYDLSPLSFLRVGAHLLLTIFAACVLRHVFAGLDAVGDWTIAGLLGGAFLMGFFPNMGIGLLIERLPPIVRMKRPVAEEADIRRDFPLDLIDGITPTIKFRLASFDITDVHNLATVDPVTLYLESPYGHLEILDWIGQAQLLASVGPKRFLACREANIRDIHTLLKASGDPEGLQILRTVLYPDAPVADAAVGLTLNSIAGMLHVYRFERWHEAILALMTPRTVGRDGMRLAAE
jgi:hypothetical protein